MDNTDVELNELLGINSQDNTTNGASAENSAEDKASVAADNATNETKSKRENDRIRELVEENRRLKESQSKEPDLDGFLSQINDESTRTLLKEYGKVMRSEIEKQYSPVLSTFKEDKFEKEFAQYANKIPNLSLHKEELKKEFNRNPSSDLKGLIGSRVMDIVSSKITPLETKTSQSPRDEIKVDLNNASKDDLYAMLRSRKNN